MPRSGTSAACVAILLLVCGLPLFGQDACRPFSSHSFYLPQTNPSIQAGDFNGDGSVDFVGLTDQGLNVFLGNADGTFRQAGVFPAPVSAFTSQVVVGDFNNDGKLDVVEADAGAGMVYVLLGKGDGTFEKPIGSPVDTDTAFLAVGDFNNDGHLDLAAVVTSLANDVQILLGNGDGTFQAPMHYAIGTQVTDQPAGVTVADLNGDGNLDVAINNVGAALDPGHSVSVLLGNGDGTFRPFTQYQVGKGPYGIAAADFNGDGKMDLATANNFDGTVSVLLGQGDGTFQAAVNYVVTGQLNTVYNLAAVRLDHGARPSLAVATLSGTFVLINSGTGKFGTARGYDPASVQIVSADFNHDGKADLLLAAVSDNEGVLVDSVAVLLGAGKGVFPSSRAYAQGLGTSLQSLVVGDFNGDGKPDVIVTDPPSSLFAFVPGQGKGGFSTDVTLTQVSGASAVAAGDLNGDGKLDLAVVSSSLSLVQVIIGNGDGTFTPGSRVHVLGASGGVCCVALGDFNGDGILDMVTVSGGAPPFQAVVSVMLGNGDGTFRNAVGYGAGSYYLGPLQIGDFNNDGKLDLAVFQIDYMGGTLNHPTMNIFLGNGDGTFQAPVQTPLAAEANDFVAADFNGDGKLDMAVALANEGEVEVLTGNGNGSFSPGTTFATLPGLPPGGYLAAADFNGDGKMDLVFSANEGFLQYFPGRGDGTFGSGNTTPLTGLLPMRPTVANLTGGGAADVVLPNYAGGSLSVFLNRCPAP